MQPDPIEQARQNGRETFESYVGGNKGVLKMMQNLRALGEASSPEQRAMIEGWNEAEEQLRTSLRDEQDAIRLATGLTLADSWRCPPGTVPFLLLGRGESCYLLDDGGNPDRTVQLVKQDRNTALASWGDGRVTRVPTPVAVHPWTLVAPLVPHAPRPEVPPPPTPAD